MENKKLDFILSAYRGYINEEHELTTLATYLETPEENIIVVQLTGSDDEQVYKILTDLIDLF